MERAPGFMGTAGVPLVWQANVSYKSELIPTNMPKLSERILAYLMSRGRIGNLYPSPKHLSISCEIDCVGFGINSRNNLCRSRLK